MSKHYWLTGGGTGIGAALALELAKQGHKVTVSGRRIEPLKTVAKGHENISYHPCDVTNPDDIATCLDAIGAIDGAILNAGAYDPGPTHKIDIARFRTQMDVNYFGIINACEKLIPAFEKKGGHLVLVASLAGLRGLPNASGYGPSKAAVISFAESLNAELRSSPIRVQLVNPGFVKSELTDKNDFEMPFLLEPEEAAQAIYRGMQKNRFEISFPRPFVAILKLLKLLPYGLYFPTVAKATKHQDAS